MAASKKYKPETHWNQTAFEELKATWSPERIAEDEKTLQEIFSTGSGFSASEGRTGMGKTAWCKVLYRPHGCKLRGILHIGPGSGVVANLIKRH